MAAMRQGAQGDRCYNCGINGHKAPACTRPVDNFYCYNCHGFGHRGFEFLLPRDCNVNRSVKRNSRFPTSYVKRFKKMRDRNSFSRRGRSYNAPNRGNPNVRRYTRFAGRQNNYNSQNQNNYNRSDYNNTNPNTSYSNFRRSNRGRGSGELRGGRRQNNYNNNPINTNNREKVQKNVSNDNSRTGVTEIKPQSISQVNMIDINSCDNFRYETVCRKRKEPEPDYIPIGDWNSYRNIPQQHLVFREEQWWLNRTTFEAEKFYCDREAAEPILEEAR